MSHDAKLFSRAHNIWRSDDIQVLNAGIKGSDTFVLACPANGAGTINGRRM
jgi:hypothetical protein